MLEPLEIIQRDIPEFVGRYFATNEGKIYAHTRMYTTGNPPAVRIQPEQEIKPFKDANGYWRVGLSKGERKRRKTYSVARLIATTFIPNPENKPEVNHLRGKDDNRPQSLAWATKAENNKHAYDTGLNVSRKGQQHPRSKFSNEDAKLIKECDLPTTVLAEAFGVTVGCINKIKSGYAYGTGSF